MAHGQHVCPVRALSESGLPDPYKMLPLGRFSPKTHVSTYFLHEYFLALPHLVFLNPFTCRREV